VLVSRGTQAPHLQTEAPAGTTVEIRPTLTPNWSAMRGAIGGGPQLVADGKPVFRADEGFGDPVLNGRTARSAVGQFADGRILLVTVEGGTSAYSVGMTNFEFASAIARLGARVAYALGTGPSASLAFDGSLLTRPSAGASEQPISDALVLAYTGVYAAPPLADVVSPNGDGVDDTQTFTVKVVKPTQLLTATVTGPDGKATVIAQAGQQPGTVTIPWDPKSAAEGDWTFSVTDGTTTATRPFSINDTVGALTIDGGAISFALAHAADVAVTVEKANGVTVATVLAKKLTAGQQRLTWNGTPRSGYRVRVTATNSIGTVTETVPFGSRR
jgi:flagellar hook assembly protein FlgD